jgi:hypothetical protein
VSYLPLTEIDVASMSTKSFDSLAAVQKNAQKCTGFRKRLITVCQEEFRAAVCSVSNLILHNDTSSSYVARILNLVDEF